MFGDDWFVPSWPVDRVINFIDFMLDSIYDPINEKELRKEITMFKKKEEPARLYRQGDVLLVRVEECPEKAKKLPTVTVALGEVTGHHHTFERGATLMELDEQVWVVATEPAPLVHQEHDTILVEPGTYEVRIQREYEPEQGSRRVLD